MDNEKKKVVIDTALGNIIGEHTLDKVTLVGVYPFKDSSYVDDIELVLNFENNSKVSIRFPYSGYNMQLFIADFTNDKRDEIMIRGGFGGSGGFEIGVIYKYEDGNLIKIFDQNEFYNQNKCTAKYEDNYKVNINCGRKKYLLDISSRPKEYLDLIYDSDGKLKENSITLSYVDAPNVIYPVKQVYNSYYELLIQQRVVGIVNVDTLAVIQTLISLENTTLNEIYKGLLIF